MNSKHTLLLIIGSLLLLLGMQCNLRPVPVPVASGGTVATGGAAATGGSAVAGSPGVAGASSAGAPAAQSWPECNPPTRKAGPSKRRPLGRRSGAAKRLLAIEVASVVLPDVGWQPLLPALDQGSVGACTGFAALQCRLTRPWQWDRALSLESLNSMALSVYSGATRRDRWSGAWPPDDTGSDVVSALEQATADGYWSGYTAIGSFVELQYAVQKQPCVVGTDWYDGFFEPDACGRVAKTGTIAGGHAWVLHGFRYSTGEALGRTSWGEFGVNWEGKSGFFWVKIDVLKDLLANDGDAVCPWVMQ